MATLTTNISSVSLTVSGNTTQSTNISWTCPAVPAGSTINSCTLTGTATASMNKGNATIKVNGTTVSSGSSFTINLGTSNTTSSVTATAVGGNKNANGTVTFSNLVYTVNYSEPVVTYIVTFKDWDGTILKTESVGAGSSATAPSTPNRSGYAFTGWSVDFSNVTSNIITVAQYEKISVLKVKDNGNWVNMLRVFKKISGSWVEQTNDSWENLFSNGYTYIRKESPAIPTAVFYSDGTLIFSPDERVDSSYGDILATYTGWDKEEYDFVPWYDNRNNIQSVYVNDVSVQSLDGWFYNCNNLKNIYFNNFNTSNVTNMTCLFMLCSSLSALDLSGFDTQRVTTMPGMFMGCSSLTTLNLSNFNTSNVTDMMVMFSSCSSLTSLDLSSFDMSKVTNTTSMFAGCTSLRTIYVKDEIAKTKIESSEDFPSTATVVIGSPNN